jgi:uncharacterized protein
MSQAAKAQEPSMEEILASIRRIIADDDGAKPAPKIADKIAEKIPEKPPEPPARAAAPPAVPKEPAPKAPEPPAAAVRQDDIDAMLAGLDDKPDEPAEVLELTEAMEAQPAKFRTIDGVQDVVFDDSASEPVKAAAPPPRPAPSTPALAEAPIISQATAAAVDSAFNTLAHTVLVQNAKTLEDLVKEMLRPMLQHWLDNNLPTLVERLVRQEIERVARGR